MVHHLTAMGHHLPYGIPPDTSERARLNPSHAGWYSIYLPRRDGRLSWPIVDLIKPRLEVEPAAFRSRVRRRTAAPPRQANSRQPQSWIGFNRNVALRSADPENLR